MWGHPEDESALQDLAGSLLTNPHSGHAAWGSDASALEREAEARALTLAMCNAPAEEYECIFTSGATGWLPGRASFTRCISRRFGITLNGKLMSCCSMRENIHADVCTDYDTHAASTKGHATAGMHIMMRQLS